MLRTYKRSKNNKIINISRTEEPLEIVINNTGNAWQRNIVTFKSLRISEINLFYNLQIFYWHFVEILWFFIFLVLYLFHLQVMILICSLVRVS